MSLAQRALYFEQETGGLVIKASTIRSLYKKYKIKWKVITNSKIGKPSSRYNMTPSKFQADAKMTLDS